MYMIVKRFILGINVSVHLICRAFWSLSVRTNHVTESCGIISS